MFQCIYNYDFNFNLNCLSGADTVYSKMDYLDEKKASLMSKETSFSEMPMQEKIEAVQDIGRAALPNILTSLASSMKDVISLYFIGHLNQPILFAALGFGATWVNAFATALTFGLAAGFGIVASQAYGAGNYRKFGLLYQKSIVVITAILLCISSVLYFTEAELLFFGFEAELAANIGFFVRCLMLDLFTYMIYETTRFYLVAQNKFHIPAIALAISTTSHVFWCYIFVNVCGYGLGGVAMAKTLANATSAAICYSYVTIKNPCPESWFPWTKECLTDLVGFGKEIASHGSSIYAEWIAFEITTMILGFLGDVKVLAAHVAALNYLFINSTVSLGVTLAMSIFVGNAAGEGSLAKVKKYAYVGLIMNFAVVTFLDILMFTFRSQIASFYTEEPEVNALIKAILLIYFFGMHADLCCNTFAYLLRSLGQERFVLKGFFFSYYGVGVTCSLVTAIGLGFGYKGVWGSLILGCIILLALNAYRFFNLDWAYEVRKISSSMKRRSIECGSLEDIEMQKIETV